MSRYQKGKTNLDFTEARDSEWQWHQLGHMQVYTSLLTDNHASTHHSVFLQAGCPSCHPTNSSVKALKPDLHTSINPHPRYLAHKKVRNESGCQATIILSSRCSGCPPGSPAAVTTVRHICPKIYTARQRKGTSFLLQ